MLLILLNWLVLAFIAGSFGWVSLKALRYLFKISKGESKEVSLPLIILLGLASVTTFCNISSFFFRINWEIFSFSFLLAGIIFFVERKNIAAFLSSSFKALMEWKVAAKIGLLFFIIIALLKSSGSSEIIDEGAYYLPLIKWIEEFPIVVGIGNIEDRISFNSTLHMLSAFNSWVWVGKGGMYDVNAFLLVIFGSISMQGLDRLIKGTDNFSSDLVFVFLLVIPFRVTLTSIDTDFPNIFFGSLILLLFLKKIEYKEMSKWDEFNSLITAFFFFLFTIKIISAFFGLLIAYMLYCNQKQIKPVFLLGILIVTPWLIRNIFISGYLIYPIYFIDLFNVDWKVPLTFAENQYFYVGNYAKFAKVNLIHDVIITEIPLREWAPIWFNRELQFTITKIFLFLFPISTIGFLAYLFFVFKERKTQFRVYLFLFLMLCFLIGYWFLNFPTFRFAWGWIWFYLLLGLSFLLIRIYNQYRKLFTLFTVLVFFVFQIRNTYKSISESKGYEKLIIFPASSPKVKMESITVEGMKVNVSLEKHCWGAELPCFPSYYDRRLEPRGEDLRSGFRMKKEVK